MQNMTMHFIFHFFIIRINWHSRCGICWYSICYICWYTICDIYNFITQSYWFISNFFFQIAAILTNACARIPAIIFFTYTILFALTLSFIIIPVLIWITCCTIEFVSVITLNMFYITLTFISFVLLGTHNFVDISSTTLQLLLMNG